MLKYFVAALFLSVALGRPNIKKVAGSTDDIPLVTFDGNPSTTFKFRQTNDPVMVRMMSI